MDDERYLVIPLSIQPDGADFLIGNAELDEYYQVPAQGVGILTLLGQGRTPAEIKTALAATGEEMVDVDDFIAMLREIGLVYPAGEADGHQRRLAAQGADNRILFHADPRIASALFSLPALIGYLALVGYAGYLAVLNPALRLHLDAFFIERDLALTLVLLLALSSAAVALHELGHMLAAARHGVSSRLGIGHRLWNIVAEADLSGIWALPKRRRYLPLAAGMMVDIGVIAGITLLLAALHARGVSGFVQFLLHALILQIVVTMIWQFNLFLRTDVYYLLSNYLSYPNLDADARLYLRDRLYRASSGRFGAPTQGAPFKDVRLLRLFALLWLVGRIGALAVLVLIFLPTLAAYAMRTYHAYRDPAASIYTVYDLGAFFLLSSMVFAGGMYLWLRRRWPARRRVEEQPQ